MQKRWVVAAYLLLFGASIIVYIRYPAQQDHLRFWIPQALLMLTLVVTSLYVLLTAELVSETRRLQQRPLLEVSFLEVEVGKSVGPRFHELYGQGLGIFRGVAKMIGGEQLTTPPKALAIELKNIGQATARSVAIGLKLAVPNGAFTERLELNDEIKKDEAIQIQIVPASLPYGTIEVVNLSYGDGLKTYIEYSGGRVFRNDPGPGGGERTAIGIIQS